jgi:hypothetical protein
MIFAGLMIRLGKTYGNLMVDVQSTNQKLEDRTRRIVKTVLNDLPSSICRLPPEMMSTPMYRLWRTMRYLIEASEGTERVSSKPLSLYDEDVNRMKPDGDCKLRRGP